MARLEPKSPMNLPPWALGLVVWLLMLPLAGHAQEECGSVTCDKGLTCASLGLPCPTDDEACESENEPYCTYDVCKTDADCAEYLVCYTSTSYDCPEDVPSGGCEPDESDDQCAARGDAIQEAECEATEHSECRARWHFPCQVDGDCGADGFECVLDGGGEGHCAFQETCVTDSDCPSVFSCESVPIGPCVTADGGEPQDSSGCEYEQELRCIEPAYSRGVGVTQTATGTESVSATGVPTSGGALSDDGNSSSASDNMSALTSGERETEEGGDADSGLGASDGCAISGVDSRGTSNDGLLVPFGMVAVGLSGAARRRQRFIPLSAGSIGKSRQDQDVLEA